MGDELERPFYSERRRIEEERGLPRHILDAAPPLAREQLIRLADAFASVLLSERDACLVDIKHEISANGSGSREGIALHAAAARIMRRARKVGGTQPESGACGCGRPARPGHGTCDAMPCMLGVKP